MSHETFEQLEELNQSAGSAAIIDKLIETLRSRKEFHKMFDAILLHKKFEMGLSLVRPTSFDDVPADKRQAFEETYIVVAREVGEAYLADGNISQAWVYFRTINEPEKVAQAIEQMDVSPDADEEVSEIIDIALYEGANPVKGLELMLHTHGTCNTITALDQQLPQLSAEDRERASVLLIRQLYNDLCQTVCQEVQQKMALAPPGESLRELISGRDWLFEDGNYHIDVSHLSSVVRFSRSLNGASAELPQAIELAEYGAKLDPQFQYPADPPFDDFYQAHIHFFQALGGQNRNEALAYFREKLDQASDESDKQMIAYVLVDLLIRTEQIAEALELAEQCLKDVQDPNAFSFAELCQQAGRMDTLQKVSREKGDLVTFAAALIQQNAETVSE